MFDLSPPLCSLCSLCALCKSSGEERWRLRKPRKQLQESAGESGDLAARAHVRRRSAGSPAPGIIASADGSGTASRRPGARAAWLMRTSSTPAPAGSWVTAFLRRLLFRRAPGRGDSRRTGLKPFTVPLNHKARAWIAGLKAGGQSGVATARDVRPGLRSLRSPAAAGGIGRPPVCQCADRRLRGARTSDRAGPVAPLPWTA